MVRFDPWPGNFHMPWVWPKEKKKKTKKAKSDKKRINFLENTRLGRFVMGCYNNSKEAIGSCNKLILFTVIGITIFGVLMVWRPTFAGMTIIIWTGLAFITTGIFSLYLSFKLKKLNELPQKMPEELKIRFRELQREIDEVNKAPYRQGKTYDHDPKP